MSVSWSAGNFGSVIGQQHNAMQNMSKDELINQCQNWLSTMNQTRDTYLTNQRTAITNCESLSSRASSYQAMADASTDPQLKARYQKQADDLKAQAEQAQKDYDNLKQLIAEIDKDKATLSQDISILKGEQPKSSGVPDFKSQDYKEQVLGERKHFIAKNGDHWYKDEPKEDGGVNFNDFMKGLHDIIGDFHINASDSWDGWVDKYGDSKGRRRK